MLATAVWILFLVGLAALSFYRVSASSSLIIAFVLLVIVTPFTPTWLVVILWLFWLACLFGKYLPHLRIRFFSGPLMKRLRKMLPPISQQEKEVIESGGLWWETEIFSANPNWEKLLHTKNSSLSQEEKEYLAGPISEFCDLINSWEVQEQNDLPKDAWDFIKKHRLWGMIIPKAYGGLGFSAQAHSAVITKIASQNMDAAITVMVPNSLGPSTFIDCFGTQKQKDYYLPRLARGEEVACFALTSPEAGSDAASIVDSGVVCESEFDGKQILGIRLNFNKRYITLAPIATLIGLAFQLTDPEGLLGGKEKLGITCALVPSHLPGISKGERHSPMTLSFMNGPVRGKDVFIPLSMVVGGKEGVGRGWAMLMECLSLGRGISLPSLATAANQYSLLVTSAYARIRQQFKRPIGQFEGVSECLAAIAGYAYISEATRQFTASAVDLENKPSVASAIAKYHLTELARKSVNHAMDIHAGKAIQNGPNNYLTNVYKAIPISITVEGANILTRSLIIFGQGLMRCHPFLVKEIELLSDISAQGEKRFDKLFMQHIGFTVRSAVKSFAYGITGGRLISACRSGALKYYIKQLTRISSAFSFVTDITLLFMGAKLKFSESLSARFGDIVSHFYMASAVIRQYEQQGEPEDQILFLHWSLSYCLSEISKSFKLILQNYPSRLLGKLLWRCVFPLSSGFHPPTDQLSHKIADLVQNKKSLRDKLTSACYLGSVVTELNEAFELCEKAETIIRNLPSKGFAADEKILTELEDYRSENIISQEDYSCTKKFLRIRRQILSVDEFNSIREKNDTKNYSAVTPQE